MKLEETLNLLIRVFLKKGRSTHIVSERCPRYVVKWRKQSLRNQGVEQYDPNKYKVKCVCICLV